MREQTRPVSWLEVPSLAFPGPVPQWQVVRRRKPGRLRVRSSYSGGAAPVSHRTSGWPRLRSINCMLRGQSTRDGAARASVLDSPFGIRYVSPTSRPPSIKPKDTMSDAGSDRRAFLASSGRSLSALWLVAQGPAAAEARAFAANAVAADQTARQFFSAHQAEEVEAIAACIIPADDAPGAREAGVVRFIDRWLAKHEPESQSVYTAGLADLAHRVQTQHPGATSFAALPEAEQLALLHDIEKSDFFGLVRSHSIMGYLSHPSHGGNRGEVGWKAVGFQNHGIWQAPFGWYDQEGHDAR